MSERPWDPERDLYAPPWKVDPPNSLGIVHLGFIPEFKPGDPRPRGYLAFFEWAEVQEKAGLKQSRCPTCGLWNFPQETCCESTSKSEEASTP